MAETGSEQVKRIALDLANGLEEAEELIRKARSANLMSAEETQEVLGLCVDYIIKLYGVVGGLAKIMLESASTPRVRIANGNGVTPPALASGGNGSPGSNQPVAAEFKVEDVSNGGEQTKEAPVGVSAGGGFRGDESGT